MASSPRSSTSRRAGRRARPVAAPSRETPRADVDAVLAHAAAVAEAEALPVRGVHDQQGKRRHVDVARDVAKVVPRAFVGDLAQPAPRVGDRDANSAVSRSCAIGHRHVVHGDDVAVELPRRVRVVHEQQRRQRAGASRCRRLRPRRSQAGCPATAGRSADSARARRRPADRLPKRTAEAPARATTSRRDGRFLGTQRRRGERAQARAIQTARARGAEARRARGGSPNLTISEFHQIQHHCQSSRRRDGAIPEILQFLKFPS